MRELVCILLLLALHGSRGGEAYNDGAHHSKLGSSSVVKRAAGDPFSRRSAVDKNFIRFGRSGDYFHEQPGPPQKNLMSFARVSRAAKDNFMRFGRGDLDTLFLTPTAESTQNNNRRGENFMRFGRAKDNFMRFGRGKDNFMRFGRTFMRFGRGKQDNFMRFGRGENFMRFGKSKDNFMRFGKKDKDNFMRFGRKDNFMRFGRVPDDVLYDDVNSSEIDDKPDGKQPFVRLGKVPKNQDGYVRFGRSDSADTENPKIDDDGPEVEIGDLDLEADKSKNGPIIRIKRDTQPTSLWEVEAADMKRVSRDAELMEEIPPLTAGDKRTLKGLKKRFVDPESFSEADIQWVDSDTVDPLEAYNSPDMIFSEGKRNAGGGSSFIRFG